jgi:hypothetical protein
MATYEGRLGEGDEATTPPTEADSANEQLLLETAIKEWSERQVALVRLAAEMALAEVAAGKLTFGDIDWNGDGQLELDEVDDALTDYLDAAANATGGTAEDDEPGVTEL